MNPLPAAGPAHRYFDSGNGWVMRRVAMITFAMLATALMPATTMAAGRQVALLIGVGQYKNFGPRAQLAGPPSDVQALRSVLVRRWGFSESDVRTLVDEQASRANIMAELAALKQRSATGDNILVYFSGHGTSAFDSTNRLPVPHGSGAFIPHDFDPGAAQPLKGLIVGRTDLVPVFSALESGGRRLWVISDSCYSGQQVRSIQWAEDGQLPERTLPVVLGKDEAAQRADLILATTSTKAEPYPYRSTAFLAASSEGERARDISGRFLKTTPTLDGRPHGAMTDALLRILEGQIPGDLDGDGYLTLNEVHRATADFMTQRAYGHTPQRLPAVAEDDQGLGNRPVLNARGVAAPARSPSLEPLRVAMDAIPSGLAKAIDGVPDVSLVHSADNRDLLLRARQTRVELVSGSGDLLASIDSPDTGRVVAQVRQLAWSKRLRLLAERHRRGALAMEVDPPQFGGNFVIGQKIAFVVRPDRPATLLLLNINSEGKVSVLYPYNKSDPLLLPANSARFIPGEEEAQRIQVQKPYGMDLQFAFAFDQAPAGLERLFNTPEVDPSDPRLAAIEGWVQTMSGRFTFATGSLRTLKP